MSKQTLTQVEEQLKDMREESRVLSEKITRKYKQWEKLSKEANKDNLKDIDWLITHPESPGQYEALKDYMEEKFGGEYRGVQATGYTHDGHHTNLEQNFELSLDTYGKYELKDTYINNAKLFIKDTLPKIKRTLEVWSRWTNKFPPFQAKILQYMSGSSGLSYLLLDEEGVWYKGTLYNYGQWDVVKKFDNVDEALEYAYDEANKEGGW